MRFHRHRSDSPFEDFIDYKRMVVTKTCIRCGKEEEVPLRHHRKGGYGYGHPKGWGFGDGDRKKKYLEKHS